MKTIVTILFIASISFAKAQDSSSAYSKYVERQICYKEFTRVVHVQRAPAKPQYSDASMYLIPRYEIPKGSVFCRMEDKLNRATKVWIKVGTNNNK